jgi:hypothetical protein
MYFISHWKHVRYTSEGSHKSLQNVLQIITWSVFFAVFRQTLISVFAVMPKILFSVFASSCCVLLGFLLYTRCVKNPNRKCQEVCGPGIFVTNISFKYSSARKEIPQQTGLRYCPGRMTSSDSALNTTFFLTEALLMCKTTQLWINKLQRSLFLHTSNVTLSYKI